MIAGQPVAVLIAERWLTDRATLESPVASGTGWTTVATGVPCRLLDPSGISQATPGGLVNLQKPSVFFKRSQTLAVDWRITLTSQANRRLKVDSLVVAPEAPVQYVTASGTR
jgi:hypothetical protein